MGKRGEINPVYGCSTAAFFGKFRSLLRKEWKNSKPHKDAVLNVRQPCIDGTKRKFIVPCNACGAKYYLNERVDVLKADKKGTKNIKCYSVHHKIECGSLKSFEDLSEFTRKLFCPSEDLEVLCYQCHTKTHKKA